MSESYKNSLGLIHFVGTGSQVPKEFAALGQLGSKNNAMLKKQLSKSNLNSTQLEATLRGVVRIENRENLGNVLIRVDPPPSDLWDIFEFGTFLKNVDPHPSDQIGTFLNFRHFS